jgi:hypothetical protein
MAAPTNRRRGRGEPAATPDNKRLNTRDLLAETERRQREERDNAGARGRTSPRDNQQRDNNSPSAQKGPRKDDAPVRSNVRYVYITGAASYEADVFESPMPLRWVESGGFGALLKAGLYLQRDGSLTLISRDGSFERAVMFVMWEDPHQTFTTSDGRDVKPGLHAGFLVRSTNADGPPWIPIILPVEATSDEVERGLLSPWLDQVAAIRFNGTMSVGKKGPVVASHGDVEEEAGTDALLDTMRWLAANPDNDSPQATVCRRILVANGHGLQRLGIALIHQPASVRADALHNILSPLAPEAALVLQALWTFQEQEQTSRAFAQLITALAPCLAPDHGIQTPAAIAALATWTVGLFGARPDRENLQPARALFWALHLLRESGRHVEAFAHVDAVLPSFPTDANTLNDILRAIGLRGRDASPLEGIARALALTEIGWDLGTVRRDFLRAFPPLASFLRRYPIAYRTVGGRFDYLITAWSFRGAEVHSPRADLSYLNEDLLLDSPSVATTRAYARVLGARNRAAGALLECVKRAQHPVFERLAAMAILEDEEVVATFDKLTTQRKLTRDALYDAVAAAEFLISAREHGRPVEGFVPPSPDRPDAQTGLVRAHFMYWRMFCRSVRPEWASLYDAFLDAMLPQLTTLPAKLQIEVMALMASWLRMGSANVERALAAGWDTIALQRLRATLDDETQLALGGELAQLSMRALADMGASSYVAGLDIIAAHDAFPMVDMGRILGLARARRQRDEVLHAPSFSVIHRRLADSRSPVGAWGRAEWTRLVVERARKARSLQWLLDPARQSAVVGSAEFIRWFAHQGAAAIERPDDAYIQLLEVCLPLVPTEQALLILHHLAAHTLWGNEQVARVADDAGHTAAAVIWMTTAGILDGERATSLFRRILGRARSGRDFRMAASALLLARRAGAETDGLVNDLTAAIGSYRPMRQHLDGLVELTTGWRLAGLPADHPTAVQLMERAAAWYMDSGDERLLDWIQWGVQNAILQSASDVPLQLVRGTCDAVPIPASLSRLVSIANKAARQDKRRGGRGRELSRAITHFGDRGPVFTAVLVELAASPTAAALVDALLSATPATQDEPATTTSGTESHDSGADTAADTSADNVTDEGAEPADDAADTDAVESPAPVSAAQSAASSDKLRLALTRIARRAAERWNLELQSQDESDWQGWFDRPALTATWDVRTELLPSLHRELGRSGLAAADLLGALLVPSADIAAAEFCVDDLGTTAALIAAFVQANGLAGRLVMDARGVVVEGLRRADEPSADADAAPEADPDDTDTIASAPADGESDDAGDTSPESETESDAPAESSAGATSAARKRLSRNELERLWNGLRRGASMAEATAALGSPALARRYLELLARNPDLHVITVGQAKGRQRQRKEQAGLAWIVRPPRQGGR